MYTNFRAVIQSSVATALKNLGVPDVPPTFSIDHPTNPDFGDYSTNAAMMSFKAPTTTGFSDGGKIKSHLYPVRAKTVKDLANKMITELGRDSALNRFVSRIEFKSPGFINFWLSPDALFGEVDKVNALKGKYGSSGIGKGKTVVIDYSAPNIAKRFGVGHLRSTVIGQALYNLYQFLGYKTIGDNHLGDWGTQFGALLAQIKGSGFKVEDITVDDLEEMYVEFHKRAEKEPELMDEARAWFKKLEEGDKEARAAWKAVVKLSLKEFDRVYDLLGVKIDYAYGESFYEAKMPAVIKRIREKKLSKKSEGAEIVEFKDLPPAILVKKDGATTYFTRDLATIKFRIDEWDPQIIIYEVGADQTLHFRQVFQTADKLSWSKSRELVHVAHGLIRFDEGKMSTRRGQTIKLEEVLDEAVSRAHKLVEESKTGEGLTNKQKEKIAKSVGVGAVKYFDLSHQPKSDIIFNWENIFLLEGNSGPYMQYTYARAISVLNKVGNSEFEIPASKTEVGEDERPLLRYLYRFPEVVEGSAQSYSPNLLCSYLFELAQRFNSFYAAASIIHAESEDLRQIRLALTAATAHVLKNGLMLLGIETPERL